MFYKRGGHRWLGAARAKGAVGGKRTSGKKKEMLRSHMLNLQCVSSATFCFQNARRTPTTTSHFEDSRAKKKRVSEKAASFCFIGRLLAQNFIRSAFFVK